MSKKVKLKPFEKLLVACMMSGKPVTKEEIDSVLGKEIYMYRISTYIWNIKYYANGVIKVIKDGRKVVSYQLVNVEEVRSYLKRAGVLNVNFTPKKKDVIESIGELKSDPIENKTIKDELFVTEIAN